MADITNVLNDIRAHASLDYQRAIPAAVNENLEEIADAVMSSVQLQNDYVAALVNRISASRFTSRMFKNPYHKFIKGTNRFGDSIEEIYVNMANAHEYNPSIAENEVYKREIPDINAVFHRRNSKVFYKNTIQYDALYASFLSDNGMRSLIGRIVDAIYGAANRDIFYCTKKLMNVYSPYYYKVTVPAATAANADQIVTTIKGISNMLEFPSDLYNRFGVENFTEKPRQVLILRADVAAVLDVNSLAKAFNLQYADFIAGTYVTVDTFGDGLDNMLGLLVDDEFFQIYTNLEKFTENYNGQGLYWQYFLHRWMTYSVSPFSNAIAFVTGELTEPTAITIEPAAPSVPQGGNQQFTATVTPSAAQQSVHWKISGQKNGGTYITATGLLHVDSEESATTITVTAKCPSAQTITKTATVTVS